MIGLSEDIKLALDTIIEGLSYQLDVDSLEDEKMKKIMESKTSSFESAKKLLDRWIDSPNAPNKETLVEYITKLINGGGIALNILRKALKTNIDFSDINPDKHDAAIKAKPIILMSILELDAAVTELRVKLENNDLTLKENEFKLGYPERFGKGEFFNVNELFSNTVTDEGEVLICPHGTKGKNINISKLDIILPEIPKNKSEILFYDLPKAEQYWRRPEFPVFSPDTVDYYSDLIKEEFRRRTEGIWFMNNGVPVYLTGNHYFYLVHFRMMDNGGYPDFRYAQLHMFYHLQACIVDYRCLGQLFGKSRRTGFTYVVLSILLNWSTMRKNGKYGMMSKTGVDGEETFIKFSYAFQSLPFWFRPIVQGKIESTSHLFFSAPADNTKAAKKKQNYEINDYLNTMVDWRSTTNGAYDSIKLNGYLLDEVFKFEKPVDVIVHMGMITPTMMPNNGRPIGKMFAGSTMGAHGKGGKEGIELIDNSNIDDRDPITQKTPTGLYFHFLPAQENMEEFTDKYGFCHTEKPKSKTLNVKGEEIKTGSLEFLLATEEQKKKQSDAAYNEQLRTYPRTVEHMMRDEANECVFNLTKLSDQLEHNNKIPEEIRHVTGNFEWVNGEIDGKVFFSPNPKGRFKVSWMPSKRDDTEHLANRVKQIGDRFHPMNGDLVRFGADPFSAKSTHGQGSKGGLHGKTMNFTTDGVPSNKFVVEYIARPNDETIFFEDVIKCIRYYGAPILVENNRLDLLRHMRNRGYRPFALDRVDRTKEQLNENEKEYGGQPMSGKDIIDSHMNTIGSWIQKYVGYASPEPEGVRPEGEMGDMCFNDTIRDWMAFNPDKRTKYDATISSGLAIMACSNEKYKGKKNSVKKKTVSLFRIYNNADNVSKVV